MKKEYNVAELGGEIVNKTPIGKELTNFKRLEIDLSKKQHAELVVHLQKYGAYTGAYQEEGEIVIVPDECDLNTNHKYKWTDRGFTPLGFGFGRPKPLPNNISKEHAQYLMLKAISEGKPLPDEGKQWIRWYEDNMRKRNEEHIRVGGGL